MNSKAADWMNASPMNRSREATEDLLKDYNALAAEKAAPDSGLEGRIRDYLAEQCVAEAGYDIGEMTRGLVAAIQSSLDSGLREWIIGLWDSDVANRPLVNRYRRTLDDVYRNFYRHVTGGEELPRPKADEREIQRAHAALQSPAPQNVPLGTDGHLRPPPAPQTPEEGEP